MTRLMTHHEFAQIIEARIRETEKEQEKRKETIEKLQRELETLESQRKANVLTKYLWNVKELQTLNCGNAIRRHAKRYGIHS